MDSVSGRRVFVRNIAAGLPALVGAAAWSPTMEALELRRGNWDRTALGSLDSRAERTLRELASFCNQMAGRPLAAADARTVAAHLRSLVMYRQQSNRDAELSHAMRGLIAREGRQKLSLIEPDLAPLRKGIDHYGIHTPALVLHGIDPDARAAAFDMVAQDGAGEFFFDAWTIMMLLADGALDRSSFCDLVEEMASALEAMAAVFCLASTFIPAFAPECFAASVVLAILKFVEYVGSC